MTTEKEQSEVEHLKEQPEVQKALKQTGGTAEKAAAEQQQSPPVETRHKVWIGTYVIALLALSGL